MNVNISNLCFYICVCVVAQKSQGRKGGEARWGGGEAVGRREAVELVRGQLAPPRRRAYFEQEPERGAASSMVAEIFIIRTTWDVDTLRHMIIVAFVCLLFG